ncbi:MAG: hypothetical protein ACD_87C00230G0001 [uncultured bacterium]|nr:MAG: hypothetical protein ACD_87C00230G0001 [uncultured bacterium]
MGDGHLGRLVEDQDVDEVFFHGEVAEQGFRLGDDAGETGQEKPCIIGREALTAGHACLDPLRVTPVLEEILQAQVVLVLCNSLLDAVKLPEWFVYPEKSAVMPTHIGI